MFFKRKKQNLTFKSYLIEQNFNLDFKKLSIDFFDQKWQIKGNAIIAGIGDIINENLLKIRLIHNQKNLKLGQFVLLIHNNTAQETLLIQRIFSLLLEGELGSVLNRSGNDFYFETLPVSSSFIISQNNAYLIYFCLVLNVLETVNLNYNEMAVKLMQKFCQEFNSSNQ
ncbi:MAG: hypothetical protein WC860_03780 [Candidatus Margulisiibacteriota bacterium]|jgi:hypothetical protein